MVLSQMNVTLRFKFERALKKKENKKPKRTQVLQSILVKTLATKCAEKYIGLERKYRNC